MPIKRKRYRYSAAVMSLLIVLCVLTASIWTETAQDESDGVERRQELATISIGAGPYSGVYYPTARAICRLVNRFRIDHGVRCVAKKTGGSIENIKALRKGEVQFAITQSDTLYHAYNGKSYSGKCVFKIRRGRYQKNDCIKYRDLKTIFYLHKEPVTVIVHDKSNIGTFYQLNNKRFNIGNPGSGTRSTWSTLQSVLEAKRIELGLATAMKTNKTSDALCRGEIDGFFWLIGHPSARTKYALNNCKTRLVPIPDEIIGKLTNGTHPYYKRDEIPREYYDGVQMDIETFAVIATFVTTNGVHSSVVKTVLDAVFENFDHFVRLHPALADLKQEKLVSKQVPTDSGEFPVFHEGAVEYYQESALGHQDSGLEYQGSGFK